MKESRQNVVDLVSAAALTVVLHQVFIDLVPYEFQRYLLNDFGRVGGWIATTAFTAVMLFLSSIVSISLLRNQTIFRAATMSLGVVVLAVPIWVSLWFVVGSVSFIGQTTSLFVAILCSFLAVDYSMKRMGGRRLKTERL